MNITVAENPDLLKKWDYEKNIMKPDQVTTGSGKKVKWKCIKGHSYEDSIKHQATGRNCPICAGKKVLAGFNDLASVHPELVSGWDYDKNILVPSEITSGSNKMVWWKCEKGHGYQMQVMSRVRGRGCPVCAGKKILAGFNDLATTHPELISEWDYERNVLFPSEVSAGSNKKIWWICKKGHSWQITIKIRTSGSDCPICEKSKPSPRRVQLKQVFMDYPQLQQEFDYEQNQLLEHITTKTKLWWKCRKGHLWQASISNRKRGSGCPYCNNKLATPEHNLAVEYPDRLKYWDWEKNEILPFNLLPNSDTYAYWKCEQGHTWEMTVNSATDREKMTCPYCSGRLPIKGVTDLATLEPEIASEWNYKRNMLLPTEVTRMSGKKVWWICPNGHSYRAFIYNRSHGKGCPICAVKK